MNSLELIELMAKARCQRAYDAYHTALMSAHENIPDAPSLLDCIGENVLDFYCQCVEDLQRVQKMRDVLRYR